MNRNELQEIIGEAVRNNSPVIRFPTEKIQAGLLAVAGALLLLALLFLPYSIVAWKLIYDLVTIEQKIQEFQDSLKAKTQRNHEP